MLYLQILTKEQIVKIRVLSDNSSLCVLVVAVKDTIEDSNCSNTVIMQGIRQCLEAVDGPQYRNTYNCTHPTISVPKNYS